MNLALTAEQEQISHEVRRLVQDHRPEQPSPNGRSRLWQAAASQGWLTLAQPTASGGAALIDLTLVFRELGRALAPGPFLGTVLAVRLAALAGLTDVANALTGGSMTAALCEPVAGYEYDPWSDAADGPAVFTFDGPESHYSVVVDQDGVALYRSDGMTWTSHREAMDPSATWRTGRVTGRPLATLPAAAFAAYSMGSVLTAAQLAGIAEATATASAGYARTRRQFGAPIGSFQAVKHRCADQLLRAEAAGQLVSLTALSLEAGTDDAELLVWSARSLAGEYAERNAVDNIQNHGAIGYTAEFSAHLFLKRTHLLRYVLGSAIRSTGQALRSARSGGNGSADTLADAAKVAR